MLVLLVRTLVRMLLLLRLLQLLHAVQHGREVVVEHLAGCSAENESTVNADDESTFHFIETPQVNHRDTKEPWS